MPADSDVAAKAFVDSWRYLASSVPGGWSRAKGAGRAAVTGMSVSSLNVVWAQEVDADINDIADLLDQVAATGLPHCLQLRPRAVGSLAMLAARRGMVESEEIPLMALEDPAQLDAAQAVSGLVIRELAPDEAPLHARVLAAGFQIPPSVFLKLMTSEVLAAPGVRCYVGEVGGEPVTTGLGIKVGSNVAIFNIATPPEHRRRGYGAAVTARAVADGLAAGAQWSSLQSSSDGYKIYEHLGFRVLESWTCWVRS